jgi:hypothetical protein
MAPPQSAPNNPNGADCSQREIAQRVSDRRHLEARYQMVVDFDLSKLFD